MHGYGDITNDYELWDRELDEIIFTTSNRSEIVEVLKMIFETRPEKVDNLYLMIYNVYGGKRDEDEWDVHAEGAEELDEWLTNSE